MEFGILGPLEVREGDAAVEIRRGIPRTLLCALILRAGETVTVDALTDLLWGDDQPQNPANALQVQVSYLRRTLRAASASGADLVVTHPTGYRLDAAPEQVDAARFEQLARDARRRAASGTFSDLRAAVDVLDDALALWRGDALTDVAGAEFAAGDVTRLTESRWATVEARNDLLLALGRHRELVSELSQLVNDHPLRERFHEQLVLALYRCGRQADALRAYERARTILREELGLDPGVGLQELETKVLAQDPTLEWVAPPGASDRPEAPAARTPSTVLPAPITPTIGREPEILRLRDLLARSRVVTLTGPAGTGKTRLGIEIARGESNGSRVVYVDLGTLSSADHVTTTVAAAVGVTAPADDTAPEAIADRLAEEPSLLVLDTCEHVVRGVASLVSRIVRHSPTTRVLATSRRPLGIGGEVAWPVPPLAVAPPNLRDAASVGSYAAVELFASRAAAVRPDFEITDRNAADVAAICLALDGLPLAIELAAARADVLTAAAIRARLDNRFALLVDGSTDAVARQQTLRSAIDWSYELLDTDQRELLARLSVFPAAFDLDAVTAVAGDRFPDPIAVLAGLVRNSMVTVAGPDLYRLLDSVRAYAAEQLDAPDVVRRLHALHYGTVAVEAAPHLRGPEQVQWLERLRADLPHFRDALRWAFTAGDHEVAGPLAASLSWFWTLEGLLDEARQIAEFATGMQNADPGIRSRVFSGFGLLAASFGDLERAKDSGVQGLALARIAGVPSILGDALNTLAVAQWALGELDAAAASHDEAAEHYRLADDAWGLAVVLTLRARTAFDAHETDAAERAQIGLTAARRCGDRHIIGLALDQIAHIELRDGDVDTAIRHATECLALHEAINYTEGMVASLHLLGRARAAGGDLEVAEALHLRALSLAHAISHAAAVCEAIEDLAAVAGGAGDAELALRLVTIADRERHQRNLPRRRSDVDAIDGVRARAVEALRDRSVQVAAEASLTPVADLVKEMLAS